MQPLSGDYLLHGKPIIHFVAQTWLSPLCGGQLWAFAKALDGLGG